MRLQYTERSRAEIGTAFAWDERQRPGLGFDFLDCLEVAIRNVANWPECYQVMYSHFRRCVLRRFPFSILYSLEDETITVHAVFDNRQDPSRLP